MKFSQKTGNVLFTLAEDVIVNGAVVHRAGEKITMAVSPADTSDTTRELDTYLGGYTPFEFCADLASKPVLVDHENGTRRDFSKENAFEVVETRVGRLGAINEIQHLSQKETYTTEENALACYIPYGAENDASALYNVRVASGEMLVWKLALARENKIWTMLTTTSNWNTNNFTQLNPSTYWDTGVSKDPLANLHARIRNSAQPVSDIFVNPDVSYWFLTNPDVRSYMRQMMGDSSVSADVSFGANAQGRIQYQIPGFPMITVCPAKKINPATGNLDYVLGNHVVMTASPPGVPRDGSRIATSYTFRTKGRSGTGITTNEYVPQGRGLEGGTMFETGYREKEYMCSDIAGGLIANVLSF